MKIVITGCAGMIGCSLTSELLKEYPKDKGNKIIGIDNLSRGNLSYLKEACKDNFPDLNFICSDLTEFSEDWAKYFFKADVIIHLADMVAGIGYVFKNESHIFRTNLLINSNVTKAIAENTPKRYIYVGTACSFPRSLQLSTKSTPLKEEDQFPAAPESGYGWSKLMGEIEASYLSKEGITDTVVLSLHNVYGQYCDYDQNTSQVIPSLCSKAISSISKDKTIEVWGSGEQGRAFVNVKDVVNAIKKSITKGHNEGVIQIGPNICTSINEIAEIIIKKVDKEIKLKHLLDKPVGDIGRSANYEKANKLLNWEPKISLDEGISDLVNWLIKKKT